MRPYEQQVRAGIALLDEKRPGWRDQIRLHDLEMVGDCVLYQVYGSYPDGLEALGLEGLNSWVRHGFTLSVLLDDRYEQFPLLTEEWKTQLTEVADASV